MSERIDARVQELLRLRKEAEDAKAEYDVKKKERDEYELSLYSELEDENTKTWRGGLPTGEEARVTRRSTRRARILNEQALIADVKRRGLAAELLNEKPRKRTLNQLVKTLQESGESLPDGVDFYDDKGLTITILKR